MHKVVITGVRQAEIVEVPTPTPIEDWALVKVHTAPMCTEYKNFVSGRPNAYLGHEAAGEVVAVAQPGKVKVGDRVVVMPQTPCGQCALCVSGDYIHCQDVIDLATLTGSREGTATYAQYLLKPSWLLPKIPEGVSYDLASLACCGLAPSFGAQEAMGVDVFTTLLITGAGPVGLGAVVNAKFRGARVLVVESIPYRQAYALKLGADEIIDPDDADALAQVMAFTHGLGVDRALDCSGVVAAQRFCIDATRRRGEVAFIGECSDDLAIRISPDMIRKGLTLRGIWHYPLPLFPKVMQVIQRSPVIADLISHTFPMAQAQEALELSANRQNAKILLHPWEQAAK